MKIVHEIKINFNIVYSYFKLLFTVIISGDIKIPNLAFVTINFAFEVVGVGGQCFFVESMSVVPLDGATVAGAVEGAATRVVFHFHYVVFEFFFKASHPHLGPII